MSASAKQILEYVESGDPNELFKLEQELAVGSFGTVYRVSVYLLSLTNPAGS